MTDFYVYLHRKATTGAVFYVGKGQGSRAWSAKSRSAYWRNVVAKHGLRVELVQEGMQEWWAFEFEQELIALYGRRDLGLGALANLSDGGDGPTGRVVSKEQRERHSACMRQLFDAGVLRRRSEALLAYAAKLQKAVVCYETGVTFPSAKKAAAWLRHEGWPRAVGHAVCDACNGKVAKAYGYHWLYAGGEVMKTKKAPPQKGVTGRGVVSSAGVVYVSAAEAGRRLGVGYSNIGRCLTGVRPSAYGSTWRYATPEEAAALKEKGASWAPLSDLSSVA